MNEVVSIPQSIQKLSDNRYVEKNEDDLFFVMERLVEENLNFWSRFSGKNQKKAGKWFYSKTEPICKYIISGAVGFHDNLKSYVFNTFVTPEKRCDYEFWILYALVQPITQTSIPQFQDIEMCCTVSTSPNVPFINLTGFCRTTQFIESTAEKVDGVRKHPKISFPLQRFGVEVIKLRHPEKIFLITTPMPSMQKIFIESLGKNNVHIAYEEDWPDDMKQCEDRLLIYSKEVSDIRMRIEEQGEKEELLLELKAGEENLQRGINTLELYQSKIASCKEPPLLTIGKSRSSFILRDLKGKIIMNLNQDEMNGDHSWYFGNGTTFSPINDTLVIPLNAIVSKK